MEDNKIDFGFIAVSGICALGLAGLFFYLNKKTAVATVIDSKVNTDTKPISNTGFAGSATKIDEPIKQITPEMINNLTVDGIVSNINLLNTHKLSYAVGSSARNSEESAITSLKKKLSDLGYRFDDIIKKAVKIDTNQVLNISQNQSNQALINNSTVSDEDKANSIAKKIQLVLDTKSATDSNLTEYLNDILNLGYIYERDSKGVGVAKKIYDINRAGTNVIAKGFMGKNTNLPNAKDYPIRVYEKLSNGSLVEYTINSVLSADVKTKVGDAIEDKLKQINEQTIALVAENRYKYKLSKAPEVVKDANEALLYRVLVNLLFKVTRSENEYLKQITSDNFNLFNKLGFTFVSQNFGAIKRDNRLILNLPDTTFS